MADIHYEVITEPQKLDSPIFPAEYAALQFVDKLRALADPSFRPVAIERVERTVTFERVRMELSDEPEFDKVYSRVKQLLTESDGTGQGEDALKWAVSAALKARADVAL